MTDPLSPIGGEHGPILTPEAAARELLTGTRRLLVHAPPPSASLLAREIADQRGRSVLLITADDARARSAADNLRFLRRPGARTLVIEGGEGSPYARVAPDRQAAQRRIAALFELGTAAEVARVVVVAASALVSRVVAAADLVGRTLWLAPGQALDRDATLRGLLAGGYVRVPLVEDPGTLSVRGALLDVWPPGSPSPVRVELDGDSVESLRHFDPASQLTIRATGSVALPPAREAVFDAASVERAGRRLRALCDAENLPTSKTRQLIDDVTGGRAFFGADAFLPAFVDLQPLAAQLPGDAALVVEEPEKCDQAMEAAWQQAVAAEAELLGEPRFPLHELVVAPAEVRAWLDERPSIAVSETLVAGALSSGGADAAPPSVAVERPAELQRAVAAARAQQGHGGSLEPVVAQLNAWRDERLRVVIAARTTTQAERLAELLGHREVPAAVIDDATERWRALWQPAGRGPAPVYVAVGTMREGFVAPAEGVVVLTEQDVLGTTGGSGPRRHKRPRTSRRLLDDLRSLAEGDHVVHVEHGIGRYQGLEHRTIGGATVELLVVAYRDGDRLFLPVYRMNQIHKYSGSQTEPRLDRLGGLSFAKSKTRAKKRARDIADRLLALYAERRRVEGVRTPNADDEYRAFEATFPFEETEDQARAIEEVGADLESPVPMDRLVCGDVGFGKTEVALRAAFRVAMSGRQVAVLCPTTVLAQQHLVTFCSRLGGYPLVVEMLSRFTPKREQAAVVAGLRRGAVDVVIGTHRLLSKDVHFKDLGLVVIDEEQRFGVTAKERLKALRTSVDVLTLTATPIPRTLQLAVGGLRDLSTIATPPADRRAIRTIATRYDPTVLAEAVARELSRGGQVFYVFNRIEGLAERAARLEEWVPGARVAVAHGRMSERALERTMMAFVQGDFDVLCSTAIIESGLDIPRCNTILIDRADMFGLAQLYQLRGRVGRSRERAYCYLILPDRPSDEARQRADVMLRHSDLASGFDIARLDLELRGAGDVLGAEQSGTIATVGFEMFCRLLEEAARELEGHGAVSAVDTELSFDVEAFLPEDYAPDVGVRLACYKRLASAGDRQDVEHIAAEIEDRFGRPPKPVRALVRLMALKTDLCALGVLACEATARGVSLHLAPDAPLCPDKLTRVMRESTGRYRLAPDMRLSRRSAEGEAFESGLEAAERMVHELSSAVRTPFLPGTSFPRKRESKQ